MLAWLRRRGCDPAGGHWEVHHGDPDRQPDPASWRTDLVVPYRRAVRPAAVAGQPAIASTGLTKDYGTGRGLLTWT